MIGFRISATLGAALAALVFNATAQGTTTADPKKAPPKKAAPKKAPPKKVDEKAQTTSQGGTVQKYQAGKAPDLKDSKGNTVQSSPDAYDISSASSPPPKKK